jgi:predicted acylesterase/phospholipase RssA
MIDEDYAVVFSGGGALGAWEVGCLDAVIGYHKGRLPTIITGASAGAINAAGLCAGMTVDDLSKTWSDLKDSDVYTARSFRMKMLAAALSFVKNRSLLESAKIQLKTLQSIFDTSPLNSTLTVILKDRADAFFSSPAAFAISTTRLSDSQPELFYKMPLTSALPSNAVGGRYPTWTKLTSLDHLLQALMGTSALPILFPAMAGRFDGGVLLNQPIAPAIRLGATNIHVFIPSVEKIGNTENILAIGSTILTTWLGMSLTAQIDQIKLRNEIRIYTKDPPLRICVVRPSLDLGLDPGVELLSFGSKVEQLIELGKNSAKKRLSRFDPGDRSTWY